MTSISNGSRRQSQIFAAGHFFTSSTSQVAIYRSQKVFMKTVKQSKIELNREILIQLKSVIMLFFVFFSV